MTAYFLILLTFSLHLAFLVPANLGFCFAAPKNKAGDTPAL